MSALKEYNVKIPVAGHIWLTVEAESEKAAIDKALQEDWSLQEVEELNAYRHITQGNVCYVDCNHAEAEEAWP